jgi:tetraacyldisaccharide 4'-kinase
MAIEKFGRQLILLDDAFQHRRLHRDLDIVVIDALEPFGYERVFPRGALREPLSGLRRAQAIVLSGADLIPADQRETIRRRVATYAPAAAWVEMRRRARVLLFADGREEDLAALKNADVAAFCGIGNPASFRHTLEGCGCRLLAFREFPDHHNYDRDDIASLTDWAARSKASRIVCTHKDLVKIGETALGPLPLAAVVIAVEILLGEEALEMLLARILAGLAQCIPSIQAAK